MTRTTYKRVPFNLELAKKITSKEVKGRIVNGDGYEARIICWDKRCDCIRYPIIALIDRGDGEHIYTFTEGGIESVGFETFRDLHIEVPTYYRDYSNFVPQRWQPCLVRDTSSDLWRVTVCCGKDAYDIPIFYTADNSDGYCHWVNFLPLSKVTERLVGTTMSYEELIKELDENGKD
jgi:hypothetical protein